MSFLRHEEIYRSDVRPGYRWERQLVVAAPALIGCDEFPVGYSLAGCPPAEPASASPTGDDSQQSTLPYNDFSANGNYPLNFLSQSKSALQTMPSELAKPLSCPHARTIHSCNVLAAGTPGSCQWPSSARGWRCISSDGGAIVPAIMGLLSDRSLIQAALAVPLFCYAVVICFSFSDYKPTLATAED